jgi:hypothetical protein
MADLDAGATGTMSSALLPDLIRPVVEHHRAGRRKEAAAAYARILPLINYENRQCGTARDENGDGRRRASSRATTCAIRWRRWMRRRRRACSSSPPN